MNAHDPSRDPARDPSGDSADDPADDPAAPPARPGRRWGRLGVAAVMVLCGVLFASTARLSGGESIRGENNEVVDVLAERDQVIQELTVENAQARETIEDLRGRSAGATLSARTEQVGDAVGLSEVSGPGMQITLTDAPSSALGSIPGAEPDDLVVHQQDLEAYINALWAGGAEAMMLQDQRVINGSAFRCAGNTLLLEGRVYSPPFVITVIGPVQEMSAALDAAPGVQVYREWVEHVGLGETVRTLETATLPAFVGSLTVDAAVTG